MPRRGVLRARPAARSAGRRTSASRRQRSSAAAGRTCPDRGACGIGPRRCRRTKRARRSERRPVPDPLVGTPPGRAQLRDDRRRHRCAEPLAKVGERFRERGGHAPRAGLGGESIPVDRALCRTEDGQRICRPPDRWNRVPRGAVHAREQQLVGRAERPHRLAADARLDGGLPERTVGAGLPGARSSAGRASPRRGEQVPRHAGRRGRPPVEQS